MRFKVIAVIDGDTFDVTPNWEWGGYSGDKVRIANLEVPELGVPGAEEAKRKLQDLIGGQLVELKNEVDLSYDQLVCDVYHNKKNVIDQLV